MCHHYPPPCRHKNVNTSSHTCYTSEEGYELCLSTSETKLPVHKQGFALTDWPVQQQLIDTGVDQQGGVSGLSANPGPSRYAADGAAFTHHQTLGFGQLPCWGVGQAETEETGINPLKQRLHLMHGTKTDNPLWFSYTLHSAKMEMLWVYLWPCQRGKRRCSLCHHRPKGSSPEHQRRATARGLSAYWSPPSPSSQWRCSPPAGGACCFPPAP